MPKKIYIVDLTDEERTYLLDFIRSGKQSARKLNRAQILLLADEGKADSEIAEALHTGTATVARTRQRFVEGNLEGALNERPRPGGQKKLDEKGEAILESVAYGIRHNIEAFEKIGSDVKRIVAVGGGTKSQTWLQIVSDVAGTRQVVPTLTIGASYGDAFLAGLSAGILTKADLPDWVKSGVVIEPDLDSHTLYDPFYNDYLSLYTQTKDIVHRLASRN